MLHHSWSKMSLLLIFVCSAVFAEKISGELTIFHAGSLAVPFEKISTAFAKRYPEVKLLREASGSRAAARKITDIKKDCDVIAVADYYVIDEMLIPEHATWNVKFATNEMCIVFTDKSKHANEIDINNWTSILLDPKVEIGRSEPDADPCGYRAVLCCKLAEKFYGTKQLASKILAKDVENIRPKETDLLALLETGAVDYVFLYKSVAVQHNLRYMRLPDSLNLANPSLNSFYATETVLVAGDTPGKKVPYIGEAMFYGITIPTNAQNVTAAECFVEFVLSNEGQQILRDCGQGAKVPYPTSTFANVPNRFKKFVIQ